MNRINYYIVSAVKWLRATAHNIPNFTRLAIIFIILLANGLLFWGLYMFGYLTANTLFSFIFVLYIALLVCIYFFKNI